NGEGGGLRYEFFPLAPVEPGRLDSFAGALVDIDGDAGGKVLRSVRKALPRKPVGSISLRPSAALLKRSARLGCDFALGSWRAGAPPAREVPAHVSARPKHHEPGRSPDVGQRLRATAQRLAILTDIVKTANSILEPRKVIELIMEKIQQLIPS